VHKTRRPPPLDVPYCRAGRAPQARTAKAEKLQLPQAQDPTVAMVSTDSGILVPYDTRRNPRRKGLVATPFPVPPYFLALLRVEGGITKLKDPSRRLLPFKIGRNTTRRSRSRGDRDTTLLRPQSAISEGPNTTPSTRVQASGLHRPAPLQSPWVSTHATWPWPEGFPHVHVPESQAEKSSNTENFI
jgi:hypothetical protein